MDSVTMISELKDKVKSFVAERDWERYHDPKSIAAALCVEAGELLEIFQWDDAETARSRCRDPRYRESVEEELADVVIYALSLANQASMDLSRAVLAKIEKNARKYPVDKVRGQDFVKYGEEGGEW